MYQQGFRLGVLAASAVLMLPAMASELPTVEVTASKEAGHSAAKPVARSSVQAMGIERGSAASSDTADLLDSLPGVASYTAGGVSGLPVIRGLGGDRVSILVDGVPIANACANRMNPPLSYTDPQTIEQISVMAGITPVSAGGDSLTGAIRVDTGDPAFARQGEQLTGGSLGGFYRSNGDALGGSLEAFYATDSWHLGYAGSGSSASNYQAGDGSEVHSTLYEKYDQSLTLAHQGEQSLSELKLGVQHIPYQGFPNQHMDMVLNDSWYANGHWRGLFDWGQLDARLYHRQVEHRMNMLADKGGAMPMRVDVKSSGYRLQADIRLSEGQIFRVGQEFHHMTLDDYWPPLAPGMPGSMMMGPDTYVNINDGSRTRVGLFAEIQSDWHNGWTTLAGLRADLVLMDTGKVQPYHYQKMSMGSGGMGSGGMGSGGMGSGSMPLTADGKAANAFNARSHDKTDLNWGTSLLARYEANEQLAVEFGYGLKTRSPNLYERYSWGRGAMSSMMIGWFGDGNGYVGNPELDPEKAHTVSASLILSGEGSANWQVKLSPYYTYVNDYIGVTQIDDFRPMMPFVQLQFVNLDAELYGLNVSASDQVADTSAGTTRVAVSASLTRGRNLDDKGSLYHQMPLNASLSLTQQLGGWFARAELKLVDAKRFADATRNEPETEGYALLNLGTGYDWGNVHLNFQVENVTDRHYSLPLGGISLGDLKATGELRPLPGRGRSYNVSVGMDF